MTGTDILLMTDTGMDPRFQLGRYEPNTNNNASVLSAAALLSVAGLREALVWTHSLHHFTLSIKRVGALFCGCVRNTPIFRKEVGIGTGGANLVRMTYSSNVIQLSTRRWMSALPVDKYIRTGLART